MGSSLYIIVYLINFRGVNSGSASHHHPADYFPIAVLCKNRASLLLQLLHFDVRLSKTHFCHTNTKQYEQNAMTETTTTSSQTKDYSSLIDNRRNEKLLLGIEAETLRVVFCEAEHDTGTRMLRNATCRVHSDKSVCDLNNHRTSISSKAGAVCSFLLGYNCSTLKKTHTHTQTKK